MTKADKAAALHREKNYNCCQAVVCAFAEELGVDPQIFLKQQRASAPAWAA